MPVRVSGVNAGDLYEEIIAALDAIFGDAPRTRAVHSKGTWCRGRFTPTPEAAALCRAEHLQADEVAALVRFSHASGDPEAPDHERDARGMAVKLRVREGVEIDILATTAPAFVARTPEDFLELMRLRRPDPETGQPDMGKLGGYLAEHPEAQTAVQSTLMVEPPASYAMLSYYSPHAFRLLDGDGAGTWVRWRWIPEAGERRLPDDEARALPRDYMEEELAERLRSGTVAFELRFQLAGEEDPLEDSTAVWPDEREMVTAGRLELSELIDDPEGDGHIHVFDPLRLIDGVEPSDDPVLHARPRAYSVSAYRRLEHQPGGEPAPAGPDEIGADEVPPAESLDQDAAVERGDE